MPFIVRDTNGVGTDRHRLLLIIGQTTPRL